ncbi:MAG: hypothetical protein GDA49_00815 [Rhodospirillales bacterium]|nr:hypothetical protein [Rhodospirillales bacterium]
MNNPALFMKAIAKTTGEDSDTMDLKALAVSIAVKPLEGDVAKLGETLCETVKAQASATGAKVLLMHLGGTSATHTCAEHDGPIDLKPL